MAMALQPSSNINSAQLMSHPLSSLIHQSNVSATVLDITPLQVPSADYNQTCLQDKRENRKIYPITHWPDISHVEDGRNEEEEEQQIYSFFRTKSLRCDVCESNSSHGGSEDMEQQIIPAGRYFDALTGPELEILKDSEEMVLPVDKKWPFLLRFPIGCFGISLGLGSQTILLQTFATLSPLRIINWDLFNLILWCLAATTLFLTFLTYILKCIFYFEAVRREYYHPVRINYFFAPWMACMFLALGAPSVLSNYTIHPVVWCIFVTPILVLELKLYGEWLCGGDRQLSKVANPSNHLSLTANFIGSIFASRVGWREPALFFWAVGFAHYLVLLVTLYQRLPSAEMLPKELHPVFFLFVAAPSSASVAWADIVGDFNNTSKFIYFVAVFLYSSLVVRLNFFTGVRFSLAWWAYTFPMTSSAIATIHYYHKVPSPVTKTLAILLSTVSFTSVVCLIILTTYYALMRTLFPNDLPIAIKAKKKTVKRPSSYNRREVKWEMVHAKKLTSRTL